MKGWYDQKAESRVFAPGDKVLVLLPIPGSALQARFSGPYLVKEKVGDRDYLVATPERRRRSRLCHVNMLKPYHECRGEALVESSAGPVVTSVVLASIDEGEEFDVPSAAMVHGRLSNSEMLKSLKSHLSHLTEPQCNDVNQLVSAYTCLFSDVPTQTTVLQHDIDVGDSSPIKQHSYRES